MVTGGMPGGRADGKGPGSSDIKVNKRLSLWMLGDPGEKPSLTKCLLWCWALVVPSQLR